MKTSHLIIGLALIGAVAVAAPAIGGSGPAAETSGAAAKALKKAKNAKRKAKNAKREAKNALKEATAANAAAEANGANIRSLEKATAWAKVDADPGAATLIRDKGVSSVSHDDAGQYVVSFDEAITGCSWFATLNGNDAANAASGEITVERHSGGDPKSLKVKTYLSNGSVENPADSDGFSVAVIC